MNVDLNAREIAELRRGLALRKKRLAQRKVGKKPGEASSLAMERASVDELDGKLFASAAE